MVETRRLADIIAEEVLGETELDCSEHILTATVKLRRSPKKWKLSARIVAGLLRTLAEYTDGFCAFRDAKDEDLWKIGMVFYFTTEEKRKRFIWRIKNYFSEDIINELDVTI